MVRVPKVLRSRATDGRTLAALRPAPSIQTGWLRSHLTPVGRGGSCDNRRHPCRRVAGPPRTILLHATTSARNVGFIPSMRCMDENVFSVNVFCIHGINATKIPVRHFDGKNRSVV